MLLFTYHCNLLFLFLIIESLQIVILFIFVCSLCQRNILAELVSYITEEPSEDLDEKVRFKYPNIACELLTCDVPMLNESLSQDNELLEKLYSFLEKDPPLNPLLASFLSRTLGVLIVKKLDQVSSHYVFIRFFISILSLLFPLIKTSAEFDNHFRVTSKNNLDLIETAEIKYK